MCVRSGLVFYRPHCIFHVIVQVDVQVDRMFVTCMCWCWYSAVS